MVIALVTAGGVVGFACGFSDEGSFVSTPPEPDSSPLTEASSIPRPDGSVPVQEAGTDADAAPSCPKGHGTMVFVNASGLSFCIDSTEVTNTEYDSFLAATDGGAPSALDAGAAPDGCAGNLSFVRAAPQPTGDDGAFPVASVDWCDAYAFCRWAGKRLCGKTVQTDASTGEWFAACTNGGLRTHPYGNGYDAGACNEDSTGVGSAKAVATFPGCQGGVPGIFDMNGNVTEMIDSCDTATCRAVGGYYFQPTPSCSVASDIPRTGSGPETGFRCCADSE